MDNPFSWFVLVVIVIIIGLCILSARAKYDSKRRKKSQKAIDYSDKVCYNNFINTRGE